jgi:hypothetical protein
LPNFRYTLDIGVISMTKGVRGSVPPVGPDAQEEMTVFVLRIKGSGDTLRKGFDALNHAVAALGTGQAAVTTVKRLSAAQGKVELPEDPELETVQADEEDDVVTIDAPAASGNGKPRSVSKPKFLDTFDLSVRLNTHPKVTMRGIYSRPFGSRKMQGHPSLVPTTFSLCSELSSGMSRLIFLSPSGT